MLHIRPAGKIERIAARKIRLYDAYKEINEWPYSVIMPKIYELTKNEQTIIFGCYHRLDTKMYFIMYEDGSANYFRGLFNDSSHYDNLQDSIEKLFNEKDGSAGYHGYHSLVLDRTVTYDLTDKELTDLIIDAGCKYAGLNADTNTFLKRYDNDRFIRFLQDISYTDKLYRLTPEQVTNSYAVKMLGPMKKYRLTDDKNRQAVVKVPQYMACWLMNDYSPICQAHKRHCSTYWTDIITGKLFDLDDVINITPIL